MLWMKAWLETRWRLLYALGLPLAMLALRAVGGLASTEDARRMMVMLSFFLVFAAIYLAGTGVRTQSAFQGTQGLHVSTYYTLSLPVTRLRLLGVRTGFGLLETAAINVAVVGSAWSLFPLVRASSTPLDMLRAMLSAIVCTACFYFVSLLLATFLEETWHIFGSLFAVGVIWWAVAKLSLPPYADVFRFMGDASPLLTHRLPWPAMAASLIASVVLFWVALKIVQMREY